MNRLMDNKVVLITGGSRGIGAASARLLAENGAKVVITARGEDALRELCDEIRGKGGEASYVVSDAADLSAPGIWRKRPPSVTDGSTPWSSMPVSPCVLPRWRCLYPNGNR